MPKLPKNRLPIYLVVAVTCLAIDLISKQVAFDTYGLRNGSEWLLTGDAVRFRFFTSLNEGALWGMGQGFAWLFASLSVLAVLGILFLLFVRKAATSMWLTVALAFVTGGTLGNLYDRLAWHGIMIQGRPAPVKAVRDFFHFQFGGTVDNPGLDWAIFNVADICLVTGAIMLMIQSFWAQPECAKEDSCDTVPATGATNVASKSA